MSDLVKRLRTADGLRCPTDRELEAAARIEALEAALRKIADLKIKVHSSGVPQEIARAALAPEQDK